MLNSNAFYIFLILIASLFPASAQARSSGLAEALHKMRPEAGKVCMARHFHFGSSGTMARKSRAKTLAIGAWQSFAKIEYGSTWSRYRRAASRTVKCKKTGRGWSCTASARPCRRR